jgi:hypothetical protein
VLRLALRFVPEPAQCAARPPQDALTLRPSSLMREPLRLQVRRSRLLLCVALQPRQASAPAAPRTPKPSPPRSPAQRSVVALASKSASTDRRRPETVDADLPPAVAPNSVPGSAMTLPVWWRHAVSPMRLPAPVRADRRCSASPHAAMDWQKVAMPD